MCVRTCVCLVVCSLFTVLSLIQQHRLDDHVRFLKMAFVGATLVAYIINVMNMTITALVLRSLLPCATAHSCSQFMRVFSFSFFFSDKPVIT